MIIAKWETVQDIIGAMVTSNTETDIAVTYDDADGTLDFVINGISGNAATATALATARTIHGVSFDGTANIDLSEVIEDTVGAMVSGNTETGIDVTYDDTNNQIDFAIDSTVATLTGSQTLSAKTLTSPVINTGVSGSAILDSDTMSGASATTLSSSESIKAYVDAQILAVPDAVAMSIALG